MFLIEETFRVDKFLDNDIFLFFVIFPITLIGSFVKDMFKSKNSKKKTSLKMIYGSAFVVSILLFSFSDFIFRYFYGKSFLGVCLIAGLISVEITDRLTTIEGIKKFINDFLEFRRGRK